MGETADRDERRNEQVVLFLPAHDEEATVAGVVRQAPTHVGDHPVRVLVVDDGSGDATASRARAAGATVLTHPGNRGLGAAVRTGLAWAVAEGAVAVAFCDADGEYAPAELADLVGPILVGRADYVVGSRFAGGTRAMRPHRWLGNKLLTVGVRLLARRLTARHSRGDGGTTRITRRRSTDSVDLRRVMPARISDGQSGYRALSAEAAGAAEIVHDFNYAQVLTLDLVAKGFRYAEVPISYRFRRHGRSFVRLLPYLRQVVPAVWRELQSSTTNERKPSREASQVGS